jgi:hypothetical protein
MGAKKKPAKKAKKDDEEDLSHENFMKVYKKKVVELGVDPSKTIKEKFELYQEEDEIMHNWHFWEDLGWAGVKAIMDSLK